jgi:type IV secretion system protein VirB4
MLPLPKFIKPWKDAGEANALFAPCAFIDEHVFLTKTGALGIVFELAGIDPECLTDATMEANTKRLAAAWRLFHEDIRLYQYVVKHDGAGIDQQTEYDDPAVQATVTSRRAFLEQKGLYSIRLYLAIVLEPTAIGNGARSSFQNRKALRVLTRKLQDNREKLLAQTQSFERTIGDLLGLRLLPKADVFQFFRVLANLDKETAAAQTLRHDSHVDFYMTSSAAAPQREGLRVGHQNVEVLSLRETPSETFPNVFRDLLKLECNFILASEFRRLINDDAIAKIRSAQSHHYWNQWISDPMALLNLILSFGKKDDLVADESETDDVDELTQTLKRVKNGGEYLGEFSFTVVLFAEHNRAKLRTTAADVVKIFSAHEGALIQESYNALNAYLSIVPGNGAFNVRRAWLLSGNYADVSLVYAPSAGDKRNRHLSSEAAVVLTTEDRTPYYFNVYEVDRFGMLIFGAPGAGKSVTTNLLIDHSQKDGPRTFILDIGGSYKALTAKHGGSYLNMRFGEGRQTFRINPFSLDPTPDNLQFLFSLVLSLMAVNQFAPNAEDNRELFDSIEGLYILDAGMRTLDQLARSLPPKMTPYLQPWIGRGQYGSIFDNHEDSLTFSHFQTFDFQGMDELYPQVLQPLLFYIFQRISQIVYDPALAIQPKQLWADEVWRFLANDRARAYLVSAGKTWRKHNGGIALITQSAADLELAGILDLVNEICPMKLLLANPGADLASYAEMFKLNERELERFAALIPKRQFLLKTPTRSAVLNVELDSAAYWTYTNSPFDNARRDAAFAAHGQAEGLQVLAAEAAH